MSRPSIVGFAGSASKPSKTRTLVEKIVSDTASRYDETAKVYDILDLGSSLGLARKLDDLDAQARGVLNDIVNARALVIATPVYKGSYPGLFKHLIDLLDPSMLAGKPVLLAATGGGEKHALVIEHQLRPLFAFFEAQTLGTGIYVSDRDFDNGILTNPAIHERIGRAVGQFEAHLDAGNSAEAVDPIGQSWASPKSATAGR